MTDYQLTVNIDYVNRTTTACLVGNNGYASGTTSYPNGFNFKMFDSDGTVIQTQNMVPVVGPTAINMFRASVPFGLTFPEYGGGYDTSITRTDLSGVYISDTNSMWEFSQGIGAIPEAVLFGILSTYVRPAELAITGTSNNYLEARNDQYLDSPLLITRGDAVFQGTIATVNNKNILTLTSDKLLAAYTGYNLSDSIVQVISGAASGQTFSVTSYTPGSSAITVDTDCSALSGQLVKVMPYRLVNGYSGWTYPSLGGNNLGNGGLKARFSLDETIPAKIGSMQYATGFYSGVAVNITNPYYPLAPIFTGAVVCLNSDTYGRDIRYGDIIYYNPASSPSSTFTGVIVNVATHTNPAQGQLAVTYWPPYPAFTGSTYTVYRSNKVELQAFPELNSQILCLATSNGGLSGQYFTTVNTPSAVLDITANEYESSYNNVVETSHFHIGPVHLTNGQILNDELTMTGNVVPYSRFHVKVINGDPTAPTTVIEKTAFSTQDPNVGERFNGMYASNGVLTVAADASFNASQTIVCQGDVRYGSIVVNKTVMIPVQPAV